MKFLASQSRHGFSIFVNAYVSLWWQYLRWFAIGAIGILGLYASLWSISKPSGADSIAFRSYMPVLVMTIMAIILPASFSLLRTMSVMLKSRQAPGIRSSDTRNVTLTFGVISALFIVLIYSAMWFIGKTSTQPYLGALVLLNWCVTFSLWGWWRGDIANPLAASGVPCLCTMLLTQPVLQAQGFTNGFSSFVIGAIAIAGLYLSQHWAGKKQLTSTPRRSDQYSPRFQRVITHMLTKKYLRPLPLVASIKSAVPQFVTLLIGFSSMQADSSLLGAVVNACMLQAVVECTNKQALLPSLRMLSIPTGLNRNNLAYQLFFIRLGQLFFVFCLFAVCLLLSSLVIDFRPMSVLDLQVLPMLLLAMWLLGAALGLWSMAAESSVFAKIGFAIMLSFFSLFSQYHLGIGQWENSVINETALRDSVLFLISAMIVTSLLLIRTNRRLSSKDLSLFCKLS
jgi:hypothetical protein